MKRFMICGAHWYDEDDHVKRTRWVGPVAGHTGWVVPIQWVKFRDSWPKFMLCDFHKTLKNL